MIKVDKQYRILIPTELSEHLNFKLGETVYVYIYTHPNLNFQIIVSQKYDKSLKLVGIRHFEEKSFRFVIGKDVCEIFWDTFENSYFIPYIQNDFLYLMKK